MEAARRAIPITDADLDALKEKAESQIKRIEGDKDLQTLLMGLTPEETWRIVPIDLELVYSVRRATSIYLWFITWLADRTGQLKEADESNGIPTKSIQDKQRFSSSYAMMIMATYITQQCDILLKGKEGKDPLATCSPNFRFDVGHNPTQAIQLMFAYYAQTLRSDNETGAPLVKNANDTVSVSRDFWKVVAGKATTLAKEADPKIQAFVSNVTFNYNDFVVQGFDVEHQELKSAIVFTPVLPEDIVGNEEAIIGLTRLCDRIALFDPVRKRNPFCDIGGLYESCLLDGSPGTGKTTLERFAMTRLAKRAEQIKMPYLFKTLTAADVKAQPLSAKLITPTGQITMGSVKVGDMIASDDGNFYPVTGIFKHGVKPVYRVSFVDGAATTCTDEHLWEVRDSSIDDRRKKPNTSVKKLADIKDKLRWRNGERRRYAVRWAKPINYKPIEFALHPYIMGVYLAEGSWSQYGSVIITNTEFDIIEKIGDLLPSTDKIGGGYEGDTWYVTREPWKLKTPSTTAAVLRSCGLDHVHAEDKFIPPEYLLGSIDQRIALLQGLIDGDGTMDMRVGTGAIDYATASPKLRDDIITLVRSLGGRACASVVKTWYTKDGEKKPGLDSHRIHISFPYKDIIPCSSDKHRERHYIDPDGSSAQWHYIDSVEYLREEECQCISVGSPSHLYVTDDFIVTHNSEWYGRSARQLQDIISSILNPSNLSLFIIDDIDLFVTNRDEPGSGGADRDILKGLMDFLSGVGTNFTGNYFSIVATNAPTASDSALRQRFVYRIEVKGPLSTEDYADLVYLQLKRPSKFGIVNITEKGYKPMMRPKRTKLFDGHRVLKDYSSDWHTIGDYISNLRKDAPWFTARSVKNAMDVVMAEAADFDIPDDWYTDPNRFRERPWDERVHMITELFGKITASTIIASVEDQFQNEKRYQDDDYNRRLESAKKNVRIEREARGIAA